MASLLAELPCDDLLLDHLAVELLPDAGPARPRPDPEPRPRPAPTAPRQPRLDPALLRTPRWMW